MKLKNLLFASILTIAAYGTVQAQNTQVIAHRGFWKTDAPPKTALPLW